MVLLAISLIVLGVAVGLLGFQLFRVLLPLAGLAAGAIIGFTGVQGIFGTGVVSTTVAVIVAIVIALILGMLSYLFFDIAVNVYAGVVFASLFALLGIALGLSENGFVVTLLSIAGFIIGLMMALSAATLSVNLVTLVAGMLGMGFVLGGVFLLSGSVTSEMLHDDGVIRSVAAHVDQSFLWVMVWIAGGLIFNNAQLAALKYELFPEELRYKQS